MPQNKFTRYVGGAGQKSILLGLSVLMLAGCNGDRKVISGTVAPNVAPMPVSGIFAREQAENSYIVGIGDKISVIVFREPDLTLPEVTIDTTGHFEMPLIGRVEANGQTIRDLSDNLEARYSKYLVNSDVSVNLLASDSRRITIEGAVENPGVYGVASPTNLLSAVAIAGGPLDTAKLNEIAVFRTINGESTVAAFDLRKVRSGEMENPQILPSDTVVVGYSGLRVALQDLLRSAPLLGLFTRF